MTKTFNPNRHRFHLVDPSPWPIVAALAALALTTGGVMYMHNYFKGAVLWQAGFILLLLVMYVWWRDIVREATLEAQHTQHVAVGLRWGVILFIVSEIMFFFAFFWAFFHSSLNPSIYLGSCWPPFNLVFINAWKIPLLNTIILLTSGASVTWCHHLLVKGGKSKIPLFALALTILLAAIFTALQGYEYVLATFDISDSVYGSTFYMATGFHGFHVLVGTVFLAICWLRLYSAHFTKQSHFGFEAAAWYWHFVDVVWLFLFITVYWWGGN